MKVSICIPTFNRFEYLKECLDSLMNQSYRNFEVIVSNNASTDLTDQIVKYFPNINYYKHEEAINWYENWNFAKSRATGDLIALFHDDDIYEPNMLAEVVNMFKRNDNTVMVHTGSYHFQCNDLSSKRIRKQTIHKDFMHTSEYIDYCAKNWCSINCPTVVVKNVFYKKYEFDPRYLSADYHMWFRILQNNGYVGYLNKPLVNYRQHDSIKKKIDNFLAISQYKEMFLISLDKKENFNEYANKLTQLINKRILDEFSYRNIFNRSQTKKFIKKANQYGFSVNSLDLYKNFLKRELKKLVRI